MEGVKETVGVIGTWKKKHTQLFKGATRHPFILSIRDGTVDFDSFKRWLGQDYIFVRAFVPFVASVLVKACKDSSSSGDMEVLLGGMAALNDEISWFKKEASNWGVQLSSTLPQKVNQKYCRFVESLMGAEVDYTVAVTALWAIEVVYRESFALCLEEGSKTPAELKEACERWGSEGFGEYCRSLEEIANRRLAEASDDVISKAEATLMSILQHEVDFWNMSQGVYE